MKVKYPRKFQIGFQEGTCPLKCKKCLAFGSDVKRKKEIRKMPLDKAEHLLREIAEIGDQAVIQPHIFAEPFANEDLKQIIRYCGAYGLKMSIITNGILLNDKWMDFLLACSEQDITISFSLDAATQAVYEKVRGDHELGSIERNIRYLFQKRKNNKLRIGVNFTVEQDNKDEKDIFLDKWKYQVDVVRLHRMIDSDKKMFDLVSEISDIEKQCGALNENMVIDAGGEVRACSIDAFGDSYLGNVFEEGVLAVWNGEAMECLRKRICEDMLSEDEFCHGCGVKSFSGNYVSRECDGMHIVDNGYDVFYNYDQTD